MKLVLSTILALSVAGQAAALSCMRPDPVNTFHRIAEDPTDYYLLYGTLDFDGSKQPQGVVNEERNPEPIAAAFRGHGLTRAGFISRFERTVTVQPLCFGPWCGQTTPGVKSLFFAAVEGDKVIISPDPCGGTIFAEPTQKELDEMTACINGNCPR